MNDIDFSKVIQHLKDEFAQLQTGRASSTLVEGLMVLAYGSNQPLKNLASVSVPDARSIQIQPWDRALLGAIEKAIRDSDLNLNPVNNGVCVILNIPTLTEERRRDLLKVMGRMAEEARIAVRNVRHDAMAVYKRSEAEGEMTEDDRKAAEKRLQDAVDSANEAIMKLSQEKEQQIMTV